MPEQSTGAYGLLSIIFNQPIAELLHDAMAVAIVEVWKVIGIVILLFIVNEIMGRISFRRHTDNKHVSFSVNYVRDGILKLRPIGKEISIAELFKTPVVRRAFIRAVKRTTRENPIMEFEPKFEASIMSTLQSYVSDDFSEAFLRDAAGLPVRIRMYVLMGAYEQYEEVPVRKVRIIITHLPFFKELPDRDQVVFEKGHQDKRLHTLDLVNVRYKHMNAERRVNHHVELPFDCSASEMD